MTIINNNFFNRIGRIGPCCGEQTQRLVRDLPENGKAREIATRVVIVVSVIIWIIGLFYIAYKACSTPRSVIPHTPHRSSAAELQEASQSLDLEEFLSDSAPSSHSSNSSSAAAGESVIPQLPVSDTHKATSIFPPPSSQTSPPSSPRLPVRDFAPAFLAELPRSPFLLVTPESSPPNSPRSNDEEETVPAVTPALSSPTAQPASTSSSPISGSQTSRSNSSVESSDEDDEKEQDDVEPGMFESAVTIHRKDAIDDITKAHIARGEQVVKGTIKNTENLLNETYKTQCMVGFAWYLRDLAAQQGIYFEEGVIVFKDPGHRIHDFFAEIAYKRRSTHFWQIRTSCLGIDINPNEQLYLPQEHHTCHFGKLKMLDKKDEYMFLKTENYGLGDYPKAALHILDWIRTRPYHWIGQPLSSRKEHPPEEVIKQFTTLSTELDLNILENTALVKAHGIAGINKILNAYLVDHPKTQKARNFIDYLAKKYGHLTIRKGNEVIFTDLRPISSNQAS